MKTIYGTTDVEINGVQQIAAGGTGATTAAAALTALGAEPAFTTLPINKGGTGATTAANALTALGAPQFQPNPEFADDSVASVALTGAYYGNAVLPKTGNQQYSITVSGSGDNHFLFYNSTLNKWRYTFTVVSQEESSVQMQVDSVSSGDAFPWQAAWPSGFTAAKASLPRKAGQPLANTASDGTSQFAARADHVHPYPTPQQIGAQPLIASNFVLDESGKIPSQFLPSYVDDVVEYSTLTALQSDTSARVSGKIFVVRDTGKIYRFSGGTLFVEISNSLELANLQLPDSVAFVSASSYNFSFTIPRTGAQNGKAFYSGSDNLSSYEVFWTGTNWKVTASYSNGEFIGDSIATGNTDYPWQASGWTNGASVTRFGTYNAALAPLPLAAEASSGTGTKAAREDHVHPRPTPADIGAAPASAFTGSNATSAGTAGLVPAPAANDDTKFLKGDGTWADTGAQALPSYETLNFTEGFVNNIRQLSAGRNIVYRTPSSWSSPFIRILRLPRTDCRAGDRITIFAGYIPPNSSIVVQKYDLAVGWVDMAEVIGGSSGNNNSSRLVFVTALGTVNGNADWDTEPVFIGANSISRGSSGLVPAPSVADRTKFLKGDGSWADTPSATPNSLSIGTVDTGAAGSSASASITGTAPSQTLSLTIPRGDKGDTGNNGTAATVAVGTVNTGNAGSSASVTNVGTTSAAVLDFTIPRGNAGTNGTAVLSGAGNPQATQGAIGDFYINTSTNFIFGPKVNTGSWPAGVSLAGANGKTILNGTLNPTTSDGATGDFYLNTALNRLFGPKTTNVTNDTTAWGSGVGLVGPANSLAIGTVQTGTAGSSASATISGTAPSQTLNLTIPRGDTGAAGLRKYGPIAVFQNYNQVFQNSSYNSSSSNGNTSFIQGSDSPLGGWGFFYVGSFANGFVVNPVDIFGPNVSYRIRVVIRQTGAFGDGLHCTIRRVIIGTGESTVPGLRDFSGTSNQGAVGAGVTEIHSRVSDIITTGSTAGWEYYRCYFAAYNGSNGATPQDCTITLEQV